jgi:hypothetical protein
MSPAIEHRPGLFHRLKHPAALNYLVLTGAGLLVYSLIMVTMDNVVGVLLALLLAVPGVLARWTSAPMLILLLTMYLMIDPGFNNVIGLFVGYPWFFPRVSGAFSLEDVLLAAGLLAYSIGHFRLTSILHQGMPDDPKAGESRDPSRPPRRDAAQIDPDELPHILIIGAGCVVAGQLGWWGMVLVERLTRTQPAIFTVGTSRFLLVVWGTGLALMAVSAALVYLRSSRMTREEASLILRDEFFQENRRETDRLQRWRKWYKERVAARRRTGK